MSDMSEDPPKASICPANVRGPHSRKGSRSTEAYSERVSSFVLQLTAYNYPNGVSSSFNKRREDFPDLRSYNDYLEEVEDISKCTYIRLSLNSI